MTSQEGCLDKAPTQQDATPSPMESMLKELTKLRKANQKGRTQNAEPYSMEYPMEYLKWSTPKSHVLVK